jgi:hypothetical protein
MEEGIIVWFCEQSRRFVLAELREDEDGDPLCLHSATGDDELDRKIDEASVSAYMIGHGLQFNPPTPIESHENT